jgi:hypothetical protein
MESPFVIPLACFAMVVLIVAVVNVTKLRDKELEVHSRLHEQELEHQRKMKELELELERARQGS